MASIDLGHISKSFGDTAVLRDVNLQIDDGAFVTLVGPSGCGKSTLLRILAGLESADHGTVVIGGRDVTRVRPAHRNLAMVFQSYALYPHLTVAENMATPLKLRDLSRTQRLPILGPLLARADHREIQAQVQRTAQVLQIEPLLHRKPGQLSGGQRQRAALGRAMVRQPVAFLMDEPLSNLDAALRVHMRAELSELHRRLGATFVYVTHDQAEALTMSDQMAVMMDGVILQFGPPSQVFSDPNSLAVAEFVGSPKINVLAGEIAADGAVTVLGRALRQRIAAPRGPVHIGLRPEHLRIASPSDGLSGTLLHRENLGSDLFLHVGLHDDGPRLILRGTPETHGSLSLGDPITLVPDTGKALIFDQNGQRLRMPATTPMAETA